MPKVVVASSPLANILGSFLVAKCYWMQLLLGFHVWWVPTVAGLLPAGLYLMFSGLSALLVL